MFPPTVVKTVFPFLKKWEELLELSCSATSITHIQQAVLSEPQYWQRNEHMILPLKNKKCNYLAIECSVFQFNTFKGYAATSILGLVWQEDTFFALSHVNKTYGAIWSCFLKL